jgi:hypothetical protein
MKTKTFNTSLMALLIIVAWMATINVKGQSTCATAVSFAPSEALNESTYNIVDSIYWLKFVANKPTIFLQIVTPNNTPIASIKHIYLYSGTCASLSLLNSSGITDSLLIQQGGLAIGNTYFVKVNRTETTSAYFGLSDQYFGSVSGTLTCFPSTCNLIANGYFETDTLPLPYPHSPFYPSWDPSYYPVDTLNEVCGWMRAWGTPQIMPYTVGSNHYAWLWSNSSWGEGIMQTINIPAGNYILNFSYEVTVYPMDSLLVDLTFTDFGVHTNAMPFNGNLIPYYSTWPSRQNIFASGNLPVSSTWQHVSVPFTASTYYPRIVIFPKQINSNSTVLYLDSVSIIPLVPPDPPIIAGQWDLCHGNPPVTSDTIKNWNPNNTYYYYIGNGGSQQQIISNPFTVNWSLHQNGGMLYVKTVGCVPSSYSIDSFKVFACCPPIAQGLADITLSTPNTYYGTYNVNGQVIINANITIGGIGTSQRAHLCMGPNAKIIINPGKTLTIKDSSELYALCDTMWDGIYISGTTAHLKVSGNSSIRDAKNAIVSINGGDYQLSGSDTLRNNYKNVVVNSYSGTHSGKISQTTIRCNATLIPQYPPVSASRTYDGVEIGGVNKIYIGDTTAYSKRNTFDNMDYGINSGCSQIVVYNNKFTNINKPFLSLSPGTAIYASGGRNCGDIATVGGQNASGYYRSNYFNNCFNGIYYTSGVGNYIKAEYDTLVMQTTAYTSPTGIYAYAAGASNVTMRYNKITNGNNGINCVNFGANSSLNISSNYIQNATYGIAATEVNLTAPYTFQVAKNIVNYSNVVSGQTGILVTNIDSTAGGATPYAFISHNRVQFTAPNFNYTAYGIRVQNSPHTHIEANSVRNTTTTLAADSNQAKQFTGIQVELSQYAYLCEDTAFRTGCGLRFLGTMSPSRIKVNMMDSTWFGVRFDIASVGQQGITTMGNGNKWRFIQAWRVNGTWTPATWYCFNSTDLALLPISSFVKTSPPATAFNIVNATAYATSCPMITPLNLIGPLQSAVSGQTNYPFYEAENKYIEKTQAYLTLKNNPSLLSSLAQSDVKYQTFYNTVAASNIGSFARINDLMNAGDYSNAQLLNSGISPTNNMEINRKTVNDIYMNSWATGRFDLTNDEYNTLYGIAAQQPILGGTGVYSARVMVGEPATNASSLRTIGANNNNVKPNIAGLIYPNPVTDNASIDYTINASSKAELKVFSITGKQIANYNLNTSGTHFTFSTGQFNAGIYFYQVIANGEQISYNKFIIIK